jgi:hypothetical protein
MGRVTFHDTAVASTVRESFVPFWTNSSALFFGRRFAKGETEDETDLFASWWPDGRAATRVKTIVETTGGERLHVIPGFVTARHLVRELAFAKRAGEAVERAGADPTARKLALREAHRERLAELEKRWGKIDVTMELVTDGLLPDEYRPDYYAQFLMRIHQSFVEHGTVEVKQDAPVTVIKGAGKKAVGGTAGIFATTPEELARAHALIAIKRQVEAAIAAWSHRDTEAAAFGAAVANVKKAGARAIYALLDGLEDEDRAKATCGVLRELASESHGDDVDAWRRSLCSRWRKPVPVEPAPEER